ncbi:MAG: hypothetical protein QNJ01_13915 [Desulfobacterales bacterium]|nr:hypothetical protein [Desulfobacterales bacterium]
MILIFTTTLPFARYCGETGWGWNFSLHNIIEEIKYKQIQCHQKQFNFFYEKRLVIGERMKTLFEDRRNTALKVTKYGTADKARKTRANRQNGSGFRILYRDHPEMVYCTAV